MALTVSSPVAERLLVATTGGAVSGLQAEVLWDVSFEDLDQGMRKTVDVWDLLTQGQKNQFQNIVDDILDSL